MRVNFYPERTVNFIVFKIHFTEKILILLDRKGFDMAFFENDFDKNRTLLANALRLGTSFDIVSRHIRSENGHGQIYFIDGLISGLLLEKLMDNLCSAQNLYASDAAEFASKYITCGDFSIEHDVGKAAVAVLSGVTVLLWSGFDCAILMNAREYPNRSIQEPEDDRVLRGSRDGFVEMLLDNAAMIRRRIRDSSLTMERVTVGSRSKTDVAICYLNGVADVKLVDKVRKKLQSICVNTLTLAQESVAECLIRGQWYNPFPRVRFLDRPDAAAACIAEGQVVLLVDNSPDAIVLPTSFFAFMQNTNDYYFPPIVGTYMRNLRIIVLFITLLLTPVWFALLKNPQFIPPWLDFIKPSDTPQMPIFAQLIIIELIIDVMKLASLNTPNSLSNSFSLVSALVLGEFAVKANWFLPEVLLYMAFTAIAGFAQPSFELGYAFKLCRMALIILTEFFNLWGLSLGLLGILILLASTKTFDKRSYLHPIIPFSLKGFTSLFVRHPIDKNNN